MRSFSILSILAGLALLAGAPMATAQSAPGAVRLVPTVGWYAPLSDLGTVSEGEVNTPVQFDASVAVTLGVEVALPVPWLTARGTLAFAPSAGLSARRFSGEESCGVSCTRFIHETVPLADSRVLILTAGASARLPQLGLLRPYLLGGAGVKRYDLAQDQLAPEYAGIFATDASSFTLHAGIGLDVPVGPVVLKAELSDYLSRYRSLDGQPGSAGRLQQDLSAQIGVRIGRM